MKYCSHCGAEIDDNAVVCPKCGCQVGPIAAADAAAPASSENDSVRGMAIASLVLILIGATWPVGLILAIVAKATDKSVGKSDSKCATAALIIALIEAIIAIIVMIIVLTVVASSVH
jgi:uncharacterized membrane protein YvbJ